MSRKSTALPPEADYISSAGASEVGSVYRFIRVQPADGTTTNTISTSCSDIIFSIGGSDQVINLARSYLNFAFSLADPGASVAVSYVPRNTVPIDALQVSTSNSGTILMDWRNCDRYVAMIQPTLLTMEEYMASPRGEDGTGLCAGICPSNALGTSTTRPAYGIRADGDAGDPHYHDLKWISGSADTTTSSYTYSIPLGKTFFHSILALDKDLVFPGERLQITLRFVPRSRVFWNAASVTDPTSSAAAGAVDVTASAISIDVATEANESIAQAVRKKFRSGITFNIDYASCLKNAVSATASQAIQLSITRAGGPVLRMVYWSLYHNTESSITVQNRSNLADAKLLSYNTFFDGHPRQVGLLDTSALDEYRLLLDAYRGSPIVLSQDTFQYQFTHLDAWCDPSLMTRRDMETPSGIPMMGDHLYNIQGTTAGNALQLYALIIFQRTLSISGNGGVRFV